MGLFKRKKKNLPEEPVMPDALPQEAVTEAAQQEAAFVESLQNLVESDLGQTSEETKPEVQDEAEPAAEEVGALDDIMKEFAQEQPDEALPVEAEVCEPDEETAADEDVRIIAQLLGDEDVKLAEEPADEQLAEEVTSDTIRLELPVQEPVQETVSGDTVRIDLSEIQEASDPELEREAVTGDTIRIELPEGMQEPADVTGDTVRFTPVDVPEQEEKSEAFSEGWEPEYEQPIGDYIPPQPILFRPKSRLRELKRKLVAGPERRYYELSEQGLLRLQGAIFLTLLVAVLSITATVLYEADIISTQIKLVAFMQLFGMLIAALMGTYQMMEGVADLFRKRFSLNTMLVFSFFACIADGVFCLHALNNGGDRIPCSAAFTVQMAMSLWNAYHNRVVELGQMDTLRKATRLDGIMQMEDYHDGFVGLVRGEGQVEDFMEHYREQGRLDKITSIYAISACGFSLLAGIVTGIFARSVEFGMQVLTTSMLVAVPGTFFISASRPMAVLEKRLHKVGAVLCGWRRIEAFGKPAFFPLWYADLFPVGSCMLNGMKFYGSRDPDQVIAYATAVISADGSGLTPLFDQLLTSRNGRRYDAENLRLYGIGGIGAEICGEPVLVGDLEFLKRMGVEIPDGTMVSDAVYIAVDGELCGVVAVTTHRNKSAASGLNALCGCRKLRPVLLTGDFMLTESFIRQKFGVNTRRMAFPEYAVRAELAHKQPEADAPALAFVTQEGLAPLAYAASGACSLKTAASLGLWIHLLGGVLGMICVLTLAFLKADYLLTSLNMLLFQMIWMIPGLLVTEWTRHN